MAQSGMSVRQAEELVKKYNAKKPEAAAKATAPLRPEDINWQKELEKKLTKKLGRKTLIKRSRGINKVELQFRDDEDLDLLIRQIAGNGIFDE